MTRGDARHARSNTLSIPATLRESCAKTPERTAWLTALPDAVARLMREWSLEFDSALVEQEGSASWVQSVRRTDERNSTDARAVLKFAMPHMEGDQEIDGLGTSLRALPESAQDVVIAELLQRMWRTPSAQQSFRPLSSMLSVWCNETFEKAAHWPDPGLVRTGLALLTELDHNTASHLLLATDLHAGNVLRATREPWLVIDPKPFVGDPAYDATQHLLNCSERLCANPRAVIERFADLLSVDAERVRHWLFARVVAAPRDDWGDERMGKLAAALKH